MIEQAISMAKVIPDDLWFTFVRGPAPSEKSSKEKV